MRRLVFTAVTLLGLALAYVLVDVAARGYVENRVEDEFRSGSRIRVEEVAFSIDSFPFLFRMAAFGEVSATLHLEGIDERGVAVDAFDLEVDGLVFDRVSAFNGDVEVTDLDRATTSISLGAGTIAALVGVPVTVGEDGTVTAGDVTAQATVEDGQLVVTGEGIGRTALPIRIGRFLPCDPEVTVADEVVTLTCVTEELPPVVNQVLGEVGPRLGNG